MAATETQRKIDQLADDLLDRMHDAFPDELEVDGDGLAGDGTAWIAKFDALTDSVWGRLNGFAAKELLAREGAVDGDQ